MRGHHDDIPTPRIYEQDVGGLFSYVWRRLPFVVSIDEIYHLQINVCQLLYGRRWVSHVAHHFQMPWNTTLKEKSIEFSCRSWLIYTHPPTIACLSNYNSHEREGGFENEKPIGSYIKGSRNNGKGQENSLSLVDNIGFWTETRIGFHWGRAGLG